jgi:Lectin C-type domain
MTMKPRWMLLGATMSMIGCSAVLGLDEPIHREGGTTVAAAGGGGASDPGGMGGGDPDASVTSGSSGTEVVGNGGMSGGSATGGNGGSTGGAGQGAIDAGRDVVADVGADGGARCDDAKQNGNETGLDCGGPCGGCPTGSQCKGAADCLSKNCVGTTCQRAPCMLSATCRCIGPMIGISNYLVCNNTSGVGGQRTWDAAKAECERLGMHLAKVNDKAEATYLSGNLDPVLRDYWVGASNPTGDPTKWHWLDNTPIPNDMWVMNTIMNPNLKCAAATIPAGLILGVCGQQLGYICEID